MRSYEASSMIEADPERIWGVLTDGPKYTEWDSGIQRMEGTIAPGSKIKIWAAVNPGRAFPLKVTEFEPGRQMRWSGGMPLGLFRGVRTFSLSRQGSGGTKFTVREEYTGPLLPLIWRSMPDLGPSFDQFATGLKRRVEQRAAG